MRRKLNYKNETEAAKCLNVDISFLRYRRKTNKIPHYIYNHSPGKVEYYFPELEKWYKEYSEGWDFKKDKKDSSEEITYELLEEVTYECVNEIESTNKTIEGMFVHHFIDAAFLHRILKVQESFDLWFYKIKKKGKFKRFKNENIFWDYKVVNNNDITSYMMKKHMAIMAVKLTKTKREDTDAICFSIESYLNNDKLGKSEY